MMITMLTVACGVLALELPRAVYPPSPRVDPQRMVLRIEIPDMASPRATAVQDLTVQAPLWGTTVDELVLDAKGLAIDSMTSPGRLVGFAIDREKIGRNLTVTLDPPLAPGELATITTTYTIIDPPQGLVWTLPDPAQPGRPPQIHTQGQAELNSYWFPVLDFPSDRLQTEIIATVPQGFEVISNGRLIGRSPRGNRVEFHWRQEMPHVPYLVSMIVGQFDTVDLAPDRARVPLPVFVPRGRGADVERTFGRTAEMLSLFEKLFDEPYPWDKYSQTLAWNFEAGGMENTSATTLYESAVLSPEGAADDDLEGLIAHELAHQWFGNLLTCRTWEHIWLNEGFATYSEKLWIERREPRKQRVPGRPLRSVADPETGPDPALAMTTGWLDQLSSDQTDPAQPAMATKHYEDPDDVFALAANPYPKGALVLHALREKLGDDLFFRGLRDYIDRFRLQQVETSDFRRVMEDLSGETLEGFFRQYVHRPGLPRLKAQVDWDAPRSELVITIEQTQSISGDVPAFALRLPLSVLEASGTWRTLDPIAISGRSTRAAFPLTVEPRGVAINPRNAALASLEVTQPPARWLTQLASPPTSVALIQAIRAAAQANLSDATPRLAQLAADESQPAAVRTEAVNALGQLRDTPAVLALARGRLSAGDVRLATIEAAAAIASDESIAGSSRQPLIDVITRAAAGDPFPRTRAAALRAAGSLKLDGALELLKRAADTPSQHDRVRRGAVGGLVALDRPEGLAVLARLAMPGTSTRTREEAIAGLAKLAHHDRAAVRGVLATLLSDRVRQVWKAAGNALAELADAPARASLEALAAAKPDPIDRRIIAQWLEQLGAAKPDHSAMPDGLQWVALALPDSFADNASQRKALGDDPAQFFSRRNVVGEARAGRPVVLTKSTGALGGVATPLAIKDVTILEDPASQRVRALVVTLADTSAESLRTFTAARVGGKLAILVDAEVLGCPTLAAPISNIIQITGDFTPADARRLRDRVLTAGTLELRDAVRLGERGDEAELRARVRGEPSPR